MKPRGIIVLDMDGVITSEEGYWRAAACTVIELAARLGHGPSAERVTGSRAASLPAEIKLPRATIAAIKGLSINTNWDLCHLAACLLIRQIAAAAPENALALNSCKWEIEGPVTTLPQVVELDVDLGRLLQAFLDLRLPERGFAIMENLAQSMVEVGLQSADYVRRGPLWEWCYQHFQVWFAGSDWQSPPEQSQGAAEGASNTAKRLGIMHSEGLILPVDAIRRTLGQLRDQAWSLAIATGRTSAELLPTLRRHDLLHFFEPDRIVTHDTIHAAEMALAEHGAQLSKPSPFPFLRAVFPKRDLWELAFDPPTMLAPDTIFVGDTVGDMAPARALGARGIAVLTGAGGAASEPALREAGATDVIADLTALPALLAGRQRQQDGTWEQGSSWEDYRRSRRLFLGVWLGGFASIIALMLILSGGAPRLLEYLFPLLGITWAAFFLYASLRLTNFRCPRCGERYFRRRWGQVAFSRHCGYCGLPKWADPTAGGTG